MASRKLNLINQDGAPVQMSLLSAPGTERGQFEDTCFPPIVRDAAGFKEVLRRAEKIGYLGLDYEFKHFHSPTIMGIAVRDLACGLRFDRTLHRYIADAARSGIKLVAHSGFGADLPVFSAVEGFEAPYEWMICSMIIHWFENSHLTKAPTKEESDDAGALGFMDLFSATSLVSRVPQWKEHRGSACWGPCPKCLRGDSSVMLGDGSTRRIAQLYKERYAGTVQCVNDSGEIVQRHVTNWYRTPRAGRRFIKVNFANNTKQRSGIVVTEDHKILTNRGYVEAQDLRATDKIATGHPGLSERQKHLLAGVFLGDTHVDSKNQITLAHGIEQFDYLDCKTKVFSNLGSRACTTSANGRSRQQPLPMLPATIEMAAYFKKDWYGFLEEYFDITSLAIWYMDDGSRDRTQMSISIGSYSDIEADFLVDLVTRKTGLECYWRKTEYVSVNYPKRLLCFPSDSGKILSKLIGGFVGSELRYKLHPGVTATAFDPTLFEPDFAVDYQFAEISESRGRIDYRCGTEADHHVYCIEVADFHNFVTAGGVVKNCDVTGYCAIDSWAGLEVFLANKERLTRRGFNWKTYEARAQLAYYLEKMQQQGVRIDRKFVEEFSKNSEKMKESLFPLGENGEPIPFNPRSAQQVEAWFTSRRIALKSNQKNDVRKALEVQAARYGYNSIDELDAAEDLPEALSVLHKLDQYKGSGRGGDAWFADKYFDKDGLVHPRFIYVGTSTGRLSSAKPNFQNLPSRGWGTLIKAAIIPHDPDFDIIDADLGQLELRDVLYQAGYPIETIKGDALKAIVAGGGDRFNRAAELAGGEARDIVKTVVYGGQYGEGMQIYTPEDLARPNIRKEIEYGAIRLYTPEYVPWLKKPWEYGGGIVGFTGANLAERLFGDKTHLSRKRALEIQDDLIFGGELRVIRQWQIDSLEEIELKGYVRLPNTQFLRLNGSPKDNAKVGLAFKGQGLGAVHAQATMVHLIRETKHLPLLQVHDSLVYAIPKSWSGRKTREFIAPMFGETPILPGFRAPGKVKRGSNYGGYDEKNNPKGLRLMWNSAEETVGGDKI